MTSNIVLLGCGKWGSHYARTLKEMGVLNAIITSTWQTTQQHSADHNLAPRSWKDICKDPFIKGVVIATPPHTHERLAIEAMTAGKHVLIEKPMSLCRSTTQRIITAAAHYQRHIKVGHLMLHHPAFLELSKQITLGKIGTVRNITSHRTSLRPHLTPSKTLWALAPHDLSMIFTLLSSAPETAEMTSGKDVDIRLNFAKNITVAIHLAQGSPTKERVFSVKGDMGTLIFDDLKPWAQKLHFISSKNSIAKPIALSPKEPLRLQCEDFLNMMDARDPYPSQGRLSLSIVSLLEDLENSSH